jgi:hypothetical protein
MPATDARPVATWSSYRRVTAAPPGGQTTTEEAPGWAATTAEIGDPDDQME